MAGKWREAPNPVQLDQLDEQILWELMRDGRIPNNVLAERLHVAPSTTLTRTRALRQRAILQSVHATVDLRAVGLPIQAIIAVRLRAQARPELRSYSSKLLALPHVLAVYFVAGADDFLVHVACSSPEQLRDFVAIQLSGDAAVASTQTNMVFEHLNGAGQVSPSGSFSDLREPIRTP